MRELLPHIERWLREDGAVALATVVTAYGSSPRPLGSKMAVSVSGEMVGSVSGGCVESAVVQEALQVFNTGQPKLLAYGIADEWAQNAGLACGGTIEVFIELIQHPESTIRERMHAMLKQALTGDQLVSVATILAGPEAGAKLLIWPDGRAEGDLGEPVSTQPVLTVAKKGMAEQRSSRHTLTIQTTVYDIFLDVFPPPPHLIIVGAVHIAVALVEFAKALGFRTTVIDARPAFATPARFGHADQLVCQWPEEALADVSLNESTYIAILSHDDKLDIPALQTVLSSRARYIGVLGSRQTMAQRLQAMGYQEKDIARIARIHNPIGLDLGGRSAEEIALAIMAEIVAVRYGRR